MPDITMCKNILCEVKEKCYRWTAEPSKWQAYAWFDNPRGKPCLNFVEDVRKNVPNDVDQSVVG